MLARLRELNLQTSGKKRTYLRGRFCFHIFQNMEQNKKRTYLREKKCFHILKKMAQNSNPLKQVGCTSIHVFEGSHEMGEQQKERFYGHSQLKYLSSDVKRNLNPVLVFSSILFII